jgi:hypothetical protein
VALKLPSSQRAWFHANFVMRQLQITSCMNLYLQIYIQWLVLALALPNLENVQMIVAILTVVMPKPHSPHGRMDLTL